MKLRSQISTCHHQANVLGREGNHETALKLTQKQERGSWADFNMHLQRLPLLCLSAVVWVMVLYERIPCIQGPDRLVTPHISQYVSMKTWDNM